VSGLLGIWLRYFILLGFEKISSYVWLGTLSINVLGSLLAGIIFEMSANKGLISPTTAMILLVGFCGGFTTFSSYSLQNFQLFSEGHYSQALFYFLFSPILGLAAAIAGVYLMRIY
jgi:CrcB protein